MPSSILLLEKITYIKNINKKIKANFRKYKMTSLAVALERVRVIKIKREKINISRGLLKENVKILKITT